MTFFRKNAKEIRASYESLCAEDSITLDAIEELGEILKSRALDQLPNLNARFPGVCRGSLGKTKPGYHGRLRNAVTQLIRDTQDERLQPYRVMKERIQMFAHRAKEDLRESPPTPAPEPLTNWGQFGSDIDGAMTWSNTKEDHAFWSRVRGLAFVKDIATFALLPPRNDPARDFKDGVTDPHRLERAYRILYAAPETARYAELQKLLTVLRDKLLHLVVMPLGKEVPSVRGSKDLRVLL
jgi:hypothetical protein